MLICNNCDTLNSSRARQCSHCHMVGDFRIQEETEGPSADQQTEQATVICRNCGSHEPGEGDKCVHCRFPLPVHIRDFNPTGEASRGQNLRVG